MFTVSCLIESMLLGDDTYPRLHGAAAKSEFRARSIGVPAAVVACLFDASLRARVFVNGCGFPVAASCWFCIVMPACMYFRFVSARGHVRLWTNPYKSICLRCNVVTVGSPFCS